MDSHFVYRFGSFHLAPMDTASWISTGASVFLPLFSTSLARLDLLGMFDRWPVGAFHVRPGTLENMWMPAGPCVNARLGLSRSASTTTVGVSVVALHRDLVVL